MIPFLDQGASGIKSLTDRFKDLGIVISGETAAAAEKYNDDLKILAIAKDAIILKILGSSGMLAAMNKLTEAMVEASGKSSKLADNLGSGLGGALQGTTKFLQEASDNAAGLAKAWKDLGTAWNDFANAKNAEGMAKLGDALRDVGIMTTEEAAKLAAAREAAERFKVNFSDVNNALERYLKLTATKAELPFNPEADKQLKAFTDELNKMRAAGLDASGIFADQLAPGFLAATANMEALKGQITLTADGLVRLGPLAGKLNDEMLKLEGQKFLESSLPAWQQFQDKLVAADAGLQALGLTAEQIADVNARAARNAGQSWDQAMTGILQNATSAFVGLAQKNKEFAGLAKSLSIAQATFSAYEAFNKALAAYPPPFNFIGAGVALAAGLASVATIAATNFATGGSFKVPGGMSGVNSQNGAAGAVARRARRHHAVGRGARQPRRARNRAERNRAARSVHRNHAARPRRRFESRTARRLPAETRGGLNNGGHSRAEFAGRSDAEPVGNAADRLPRHRHRGKHCLDDRAGRIPDQQRRQSGNAFDLERRR